MAWYEGTITNAAGQLINILSDKLPNNENWEIVDTPDTNEKVYGHKYNGNRDFCVYVKDNQVDFATIEIWDDWDAESHAGVGNALKAVGSNYTLRIRKTITSWGLRLTDNCFVFILKGNGWGYYIGHPKRFDTNRVQPIFVGHTSYTSGNHYNYNPLSGKNGLYGSYWGGQGLHWGVLYDSAGGVNKGCMPMGTTDTISSTYTYHAYGWWPLKTTANTYYVIESVVGDYQTPWLAFGILDGVFSGFCGDVAISNGDILNVEGTSWLVVMDGVGFVSLVRMD